MLSSSATAGIPTAGKVKEREGKETKEGKDLRFHNPLNSSQVLDVCCKGNPQSVLSCSYMGLDDLIVVNISASQV